MLRGKIKPNFQFVKIFVIKFSPIFVNFSSIMRNMAKYS